jgi:hypothetical protein
LCSCSMSIFCFSFSFSHHCNNIHHTMLLSNRILEQKRVPPKFTFSSPETKIITLSKLWMPALSTVAFRCSQQFLGHCLSAEHATIIIRHLSQGKHCYAHTTMKFSWRESRQMCFHSPFVIGDDKTHFHHSWQVFLIDMVCLDIWWRKRS